MTAAALKWWREDRPVYWGWYWRWGWLGNGWNALHLGCFTVWFASGPSPVERLRRLITRAPYVSSLADLAGPTMCPHGLYDWTPCPACAADLEPAIDRQEEP